MEDDATKEEREGDGDGDGAEFWTSPIRCFFTTP